MWVVFAYIGSIFPTHGSSCLDSEDTKKGGIVKIQLLKKMA
jgi:hypothetical protein